ncbi:hypothetical protein ACIQU6_15535 [Streptomyces sp. NPDC090442]|uniref:hypothetical protein n=1 Tax=Streptomyces sp. NPDC090442 TaxID=3365962 RepID=UPI0038001E85
MRARPEAVPDLATYADVKGPVVDLVVDLVVAVAEPWAQATGWQPSATKTARPAPHHR